MIRTRWQSALRDLHAQLRSPRLIGTFLVVVLLFAVTGPFGTLSRMGPAERLGYWFVIQAGSWLIALTTACLASNLLERHVGALLLRVVIGSLAASPLIGLYLVLADAAMAGGAMTLVAVGQRTLDAVPLCLLFCVLSYFAMTAPANADAAPEPAGAPPLPSDTQMRDAPLLARLKPEQRGALRFLSVEDHYTVVATTRGRSLLLLRLGDAIGETGPVDGLQVHRSYWVADGAVRGLQTREGKLFVLLDGGEEIPVSRPYRAAAKARFGSLPEG